MRPSAAQADEDGQHGGGDKVGVHGAKVWSRVALGYRAQGVQATVWPAVGPTRCAAVAYELNSQHWRQGLGSAALATLRQGLRQHFGVTRCVAVLKAANFRSKALLQSQGFVPSTDVPVELGALEPDELFMHRMEA